MLKTYLEDLIRGTWLLDQSVERPVGTISVSAAEAVVRAARIGHGTKARRIQHHGEVRLHAFGEAWTDESSNSEFFEGFLSWPRWVEVLIAGLLAHEFDQGANAPAGAIEECMTLLGKHMVDIIPRILVQDRDEVLVGADQAALGERRL